MVAGRPHADVAKRLQEALDDKGRDQRGRAAYLAKMADVSPQAAQRWLKAEALPTLENTLLLAIGLGVCVEWILTGRGPKKPPDPDTMEMVEFIQSVPPPDRGLVKAMLERFTSYWHPPKPHQT